MQISDEAIFNDNMLKAIQNVHTASALCGSLAITAVKITAFIPPNILQKLNQTIEQAQPSMPANTPILDLVSKTSAVSDCFSSSSVLILSSAVQMTKDESTEVEHLIQRIHRIVQVVHHLLVVDMILEGV